MAKIAELTKQHEQEGRIKKQKKTGKSENDASMFNDLEEDGEEEKTNDDNKKGKNNKRKGKAPEDYKSKNKVDQSKMDNKRKAKEGNK